MNRRYFLFPLLSWLLTCAAYAQPTWRFPISFQDGTGTRDTIWMVYDTTATLGGGLTPMVDTALGEGHVDMDLNTFNVWTPNWNNDSTKTVAWPYTQFPFHQAIVEAFNYELPVTIKWDLSLGAAPFLPPGGPINAGGIYNDYFWYYNNCGGPQPIGCGVFDISMADSVVVSSTPFVGMLFPFSITIGHFSGVGISEYPHAPGLELWPNPTRDRLFIKAPGTVVSVEFFDLLGDPAYPFPLVVSSEGIDVAKLPPGSYIVRAHTSTDQLYHARFIKQD